MMEVLVDEKKKTVTIVMSLINPPEPSGSGKTLLCATTRGNKETEAKLGGKSIYVGANCYIYATAKEPR